MNVKELIEKLTEYPEDSEVLISLPSGLISEFVNYLFKSLMSDNTVIFKLGRRYCYLLPLQELCIRVSQHTARALNTLRMSPFLAS